MYTEEIQNLLAEKFREEGFQDCFLVSIEQQKKNIQIFIDADSGLNLDKCQKISRYLESVFDETSWFGADYVLEVSSPGIFNVCCATSKQAQIVKAYGFCHTAFDSATRAER